MYSDWSGYAGWLLFLVVFVWLGGATFFIRRQNSFLKSLFPKSGERDIRIRFEEVTKQVLRFRKDLDNLESKLIEVEKLGLKHVQKVGLLRYNPYDDTGGDQSFSLAMLDECGNGTVLTSLHARSGTRVFAKPVRSGKGLKYQLSEEEEKVCELAMKS